MQPPLEAPIAAGVDLADLDRPAGTDAGADQRRAAMAGDVEARIGAALHVQVLGDTTGDVDRPTHVAARRGQRRGEVDDVHAVGGGQRGERDHAQACFQTRPLAMNCTVCFVTP
jgi:hypothetical protein